MNEIFTYELANCWWAGFMFTDKMRMFAYNYIQKKVSRKVKRYNRLMEIAKTIKNNS